MKRVTDIVRVVGLHLLELQHPGESDVYSLTFLADQTNVVSTTSWVRQDDLGGWELVERW